MSSGGYKRLLTAYEKDADTKFCELSYKESGGIGDIGKMKPSFYANCKVCKTIAPNLYQPCMGVAQNTPVPLKLDQLKCATYNNKYFTKETHGGATQIKTSAPLTQAQIKTCLRGLQ